MGRFDDIDFEKWNSLTDEIAASTNEQCRLCPRAIGNAEALGYRVLKGSVSKDMVASMQQEYTSDCYEGFRLDESQGCFTENSGKCMKGIIVN